MRMRRATGAVAGLLALLVAMTGCMAPRAGTVPSPSDAPAASPSVSITPAPTPTPTPRPTPTPARSPTPAPTLEIPHADPALEAYLPTSIGGTTTTATSLEAAEIAAMAGGDFYLVFSPYDVIGLADQLGISTDDMTIAVCGGRDVGAAVFAYGLPGKRAKRILEARHAMGGMQLNRMAALTPLTWLEIAGRRVAYMPTRDVLEPTSGEYDLAWDGVLISILGEPLGDDGSVPASIVAAVEALPQP